jgi:transcriptional regulator with XRE-family HTH domain
MPAGNSSTLRRKQLAALLRRIREQRGVTIEHVARELEMHPTTLSRIETAVRGISVRDLKPVLDVYEITGAEREAMLTLARESGQRGWWQSYRDVLPPEYATHIGLEAEAVSIRTYHPQLVPGLLQTEAYARAVIRVCRPNDSAESISRWVRVRLERQARLSGELPLSLWVVLDEAVIRRRVGGPAVMREQLRHLAGIAEQPGVVIQVLPFAAGEHAAMAAPFVVLEFGDYPAVVHVENVASALFVEAPDDVRPYTLVFDHLAAVALAPRESVALIGAAAGDLE